MNREAQLAVTFVELAEALVVDYELRKFLHTLVHRTAELVGAAAVGVLMSSEGHGLELTAATSKGMEELENFELEHQQGPCYDAYTQGRQVSEPDLASGPERWPEFAARADHLGYRSVHGFPLQVRDEVLGALNVFLSEPGPFEEADVNVVQAMADVAAIGILHERSVSRRRDEQQAAIGELGRVALGDLSAEVVLAHVAETVRDVLDARSVDVLEVAPGGQLVPRAVGGPTEEDAAGSGLAPERIHVAAQALSSRQTVVVPDLATAKGVPSDAAPLGRSAMAALISGRERPYGVLEVHCDHGRTFDEDDVAFLESVAALVGSVMARQEVEGQLRQTQKLEAVGQLAGGVAHDFNNLLQIIHGNAELLALRFAGTETSQILTAAEHGRRLVERLLTFSQQRPSITTSIALNRTVTTVVEMLDRMVGPGVTIDRELAAAVACVTVEETQLEQAIVNLVINARDAMPEGGRITVTTALAASEELPAGAVGSFARLTVADEGTGMDDDVLAQAFQPFFTTKPEGKGTGLGLSAVYGAVTTAGGHVDVRTTVGAGTAFDLFLPHEPAAPEGAVVTTVSKATGPAEASVLVVEDRPQIRQLVAATLTRLGLAVRCADDAEEALALLAEGGALDLLVTDVTLPGLAGPALADRVRALHPDARVLFMSGYTSRRVELSDGTAFLQKPFSLSDLTDSVRALLD